VPATEPIFAGKTTHPNFFQMQIAIEIVLSLQNDGWHIHRSKKSMPLEINWQEIAIRLLCTVFAGAVIGINREEHGRTAGLRTTILVCLAASLAMILANLMFHATGKMDSSVLRLDLMRLPLGILSGMGFIGAGAIIRRDNLVLGVTTAATLWFVTVIGLCFGSGQIMLGFVALGIGFATLTGVKWLEKHMKLERNATLTIVFGERNATEDDIIKPFIDANYKINFSSIIYSPSGNIHQLGGQVRWRGVAGDSHPPKFLKQLLERYQFERMEWRILGEA
jgi:putative Mg2+ transporter-C (MgtC) family protein